MKKEILVVGGITIGVVVLTGVGIIVYNQSLVNREAKKHNNAKPLEKSNDIAKMNLFVIEKMIIDGISSEEAVDSLENTFGKALAEMGYNLSDLRSAVKRYNSLNKRGLKTMKKALIETIGFNNRVIKAINRREARYAAKEAKKAAKAA